MPKETQMHNQSRAVITTQSIMLAKLLTGHKIIYRQMTDSC